MISSPPRWRAVITEVKGIFNLEWPTFFKAMMSELDKVNLPVSLLPFGCLCVSAN